MSRARPSIDQVIDEVHRLDRATLKAEWADLFGQPGPKHLSHDLLVRAVAYGRQVRMCGGLRPATVRRLHRLAEDPDSGDIREAPKAQKPRPGARLMREWNGETHVVEVIEDGFVWRGDTYRSLSAVARAITGVRWSGPRFFGLNGSVQRPPGRSGRSSQP